MKDYFAFMTNSRVTRVTGGNKSVEPMPVKDFKGANIVTPPSVTGGNTGNSVGSLLPPVTPINLEGVTLNALPMAVLPLLPAVTLENDDYEERAAILEFDGGLTREEAEALRELDALDIEGNLLPKLNKGTM